MAKKDKNEKNENLQQEEVKAEVTEEIKTGEAAEQNSPEATTEEKPDEVIEEKKEAPADDKYLRLLAEYDNFRKRSRKEKDNLYTDIKAETVKKFLPVYDNLVRALAQHTDDEAYYKGVEMIMTQFNKTMEQLGVTEIEAEGKTFDPNLHNAVFHCEDETKGDSEIVEVFEKGFKLGDKVIRFATVKVAN